VDEMINKQEIISTIEAFLDEGKITFYKEDMIKLLSLLRNEDVEKWIHSYNEVVDCNKKLNQKLKESNSQNALVLPRAVEDNVRTVSGEEKLLNKDFGLETKKHTTSSLPFLSSKEIKIRFDDDIDDEDILWLSKDDFDKEMNKMSEVIGKAWLELDKRDKALNGLLEDIKTKAQLHPAEEMFVLDLIDEWFKTR
jgi:hypothetical protein